MGAFRTAALGIICLAHGTRPVLAAEPNATKSQKLTRPAPPVRTDRYGDPLPEGALARFGTIYLRTDFQKLAFRADGQEFYSWKQDEIFPWKQDGLLRVYHAATGKVLRGFRLPASNTGILHRRKLEKLPHQLTRIQRMHLAEGKAILNAHLWGLTVRAWHLGPGSLTGAWDLATGKQHRRRTAPGTQALSGLSPDGRLGVDWDLRLREVESGRLLGRLAEKGEQGPAANHGTAFSRDLSLIATCSSRLQGAKQLDDWKTSGIEVWERATCRRVRRLPLSGGYFVFAPDGRRLAVLGGDELWVWDVARGKELLHRRAPGNAAYWRGDKP
jgi:hypothetical protein